MNDDELKTLALESRKSVPIEERTEISCRLLWEQIPTPKEPADFPTILRLSRRGIRIAKIARSEYYLEIFTTMKDALERHMNP